MKHKSTKITQPAHKQSTKQSAEAPTKRSAKQSVKPYINLAIQGGGAHGAFTWGVLDWFLEYLGDPILVYELVHMTTAKAL